MFGGSAAQGPKEGQLGLWLTWHDAATWFVLRQPEFAEPAPGPRPQKPNVIGHLHDAAGHHVEGAVHFHQGIPGSQRFELVRRSHKGKTYGGRERT